MTTPHPRASAPAEPAPARRARRRSRRFARDARGSITLEAAIWTPVIFGLMSMTADLALVHSLDARMWHVASDTARRMSVEELTPEAARAFAREALPARLRATAVIETLHTDDDVGVAIRASAASMSLTGFRAAWFDGETVARVTMAREGGQGVDLSDFLSGVGAGAPAQGT